MNGLTESKSEIRARIDELEKLSTIINNSSIYDILWHITGRISELYGIDSKSEEDITVLIDRSHDAVCKAKQMEEDEAYGQDPAAYYTLALCGEAGELANAITKSLRNGYEEELVLEAIESELPDIVIYSFILAKVMKMDLNRMVREKVEKVVDRAESGYYGKPIKRKNKFYMFSAKNDGTSKMFDGKKCHIVGRSEDGGSEVRAKCRAYVISGVESVVGCKVLVYDTSSDISMDIDFNKRWTLERESESIQILI